MNKTFKTIGTCENCAHYIIGLNKRIECKNDKCKGLADCSDCAGPTASMKELAWLEPGPDFGCIHWERRP